MRALVVLLGIAWAPVALADEAPPSPDGCKCDGAAAPAAWAPMVLAAVLLGRRRR